MDDRNQPLEIEAEAEAGLAVEPATVAPGGTLAEIRVTNSAAGPARITLVGKVDGKPIGYSHPIEVDSTGKPESKEVADED
jgi:hypothetical protein